MAVRVDKEKCNGCGTCVEACPTEALSLKNDKVAVDADTCIDCGVCIDECPVQALSLG
jgi:NAD-dependent dihydropyrimidine dehydrogenase PreA subunit